MKNQDTPDIRGSADLETALTTHKEAVFCPEPWELFTLVESGDDPAGKLSAHLDTCELCREEIAAHKEALAEPEGCVPDAISTLFQEHCTPQVRSRREPERPGWLSSIGEYVTSLFRMPVMALGTAAAVVLVVVMLIPRGEDAPLMGLSGVDWQTPGGGPRMVPKSSLFQQPKPTVAVVLFFKGFEQPLEQTRVDSLYEALNPPAAAKARFDFLTPGEVAKAMVNIALPVEKLGLHQLQLKLKLHVSRIVAVTVKRDRRTVAFDCELMDTATGEIITTRRETSLAETELPDRVRRAVFSLLEGNAG